MPVPADYDKALLQVQLRLQGGEAPEDAIRFLESRGMPGTEARLTVGRIVSKSIREQRTKGLVWLGFAIVCLAIGAPFAVGTIAGLSADGAGGRGYGTSVAQAGALPVLLLAAGVWLAFRGVKLLASKRYAADPDR